MSFIHLNILLFALKSLIIKIFKKYIGVSMRQRVKKSYPPGTFIPTPARVMAILQLCLAFTCLIWVLGYPFMGEHFEVKKKKLLYERVIGDREQFQKLPLSEQNEITRSYESLGKSETSFLGKVKESIEILLLRISKFELIWIVLGLVIPIALLKKVEGAGAVVWLFPIVALAFTWENLLQPVDLKSEKALYPSEKMIVELYINGPFSSNILEQREQLLLGWKNYVIQEWAKEKPAKNGEMFSKQFESGEFLFSVERLKRVKRSKENIFREQKSSFLLIAYVLWNFIFAVAVALSLRRQINQCLATNEK